MYIRQITIKKYRHIENLTIGPFLSPSDASDLIVFAGPNGSGKSSVLELISQALADSWSLTYQLNRTAPESSFEICIGLLPSELALLRERLEVSPIQEAEALDYLTSNKSYYRGFKFEGGEYNRNATLQNRIHQLVIRTLRKDNVRPLGFHLGSERSFKKHVFKQQKLFSIAEYSKTEYIWGYAFRNEIDQFEDMLDFLITWQHNYFQDLGSYFHLKSKGASDAELGTKPSDTYGEVLAKIFPDYAFAHKTESAPSDLFVRLPSGEIIPFSDLSSGEKQVFFVLCFFERHDVEEAVIVIDEPELHLHPSLARLLLRTMQILKPRNQIWLATQSAEVIDEAGRDRVWFIRRNDETRKAEVVHATDEEPALKCLRDFFGYSGYIGLARAMIFTEGRNASTDRKMLSRLFPQHSREIKFIPASGCSEIERINSAVLRILESNLGWCKFCLIRDRDYMTDEIVNAVRSRAGQHLHIVDRHEIENYLLHPESISRVLHDIFDQSLSPAQVQDDLRKIACDMAADVLRDMASFRLNLLFRPADFSVPPMFKDVSCFDPSTNNWVQNKLDDIQAALASRAQSAAEEIQAKLVELNPVTLISDCKIEVEQSLRSEEWLKVFPGKEMLAKFSTSRKLGKSPAFENSIIKDMAAHPGIIPTELREIVEPLTA